MLARALDSPQRGPPGSPLLIHAISAHTTICTACQAPDAAAPARESTARPHHLGHAAHQHAQRAQQPESPDEAAAALSDIPHTSAAGAAQPVPQPSTDDSSGQCAHEAMAATVVPQGMVSEPSHSTVSLPTSQQHATVGSLPLAVEACRSGSSISGCKYCNRGTPLQGHEGDTGLADSRDDQVACIESKRGHSRRGSRHSLSTMEACAAFLTDTNSMFTPEASAPERSTAWTLASMQHNQARQHCSESSSCLRSACPATSDGLGTTKALEDSSQHQMDAACGAEADAKPPSGETSSSNEAWHACHM